MANELYWVYNLPLQVWPKHADPEDKNSPVISTRILNYMPRKERCCDLELDEAMGEQSREEFFECAALRFENLARLMREAGKNPAMHIYYHDDGMEQTT